MSSIGENGVVLGTGVIVLNSSGGGWAQLVRCLPSIRGPRSYMGLQFNNLQSPGMNSFPHLPHLSSSVFALADGH